MSLAEEICIRLKIARISAGYDSVAKFSKAFDIPKTTYFQHENGTTALHIELLENYAQILGVTNRWLLTGEGYPLLVPDDTRAKFIQEELKALLKESHGQVKYHAHAEVTTFLKQLKRQIVPLLNQKSLAILADTLGISELALLGYSPTVKPPAMDSEQMIVVKNSELHWNAFGPHANIIIDTTKSPQEGDIVLLLNKEQQFVVRQCVSVDNQLMCQLFSPCTDEQQCVRLADVAITGVVVGVQPNE
jgi:transcriptional regulator with XRE-family HTH domain